MSLSEITTSTSQIPEITTTTPQIPEKSILFLSTRFSEKSIIFNNNGNEKNQDSFHSKC